MSSFRVESLLDWSGSVIMFRLYLYSNDKALYHLLFTSFRNYTLHTLAKQNISLVKYFGVSDAYFSDFRAGSEIKALN